MQAVPLSFGESIRDLRTDVFRVLETRHVLGTVLGRHEHERACLTFVLEGCYHEEYEGAGGNHLPFSSCLKPAGEPHTNRFTHAAARCLLIEIRDEELAAPDGDLGRRIWTREPSVASLALRIWGELAEPDELSPLVVDEWGLALWARMLGAGRVPSDSVRVRAATEALHDRPSEPWTLSRLARHVGLHPSHLARAFRARHGCTIGQYVRQLRLNEAARRLALGRESISLLSAELGFADQSHCTRAFRREFATTPASYRRKFGP